MLDELLDDDACFFLFFFFILTLSLSNEPLLYLYQIAQKCCFVCFVCWLSVLLQVESDFERDVISSYNFDSLSNCTSEGQIG